MSTLEKIMVLTAMAFTLIMIFELTIVPFGIFAGISLSLFVICGTVFILYVNRVSN